jgi:hypothetical protein
MLITSTSCAHHNLHCYVIYCYFHSFLPSLRKLREFHSKSGRCRCCANGLDPSRDNTFFSPVPPYIHIDFVVPPPGCGPSVTDFCGTGAHRARLHCPDDVSEDDICERGVPGGALYPSSTSYPDHGSCGDLPLQGKIPTAEPGMELGTSWLVVRSSDHQATRLVVITHAICRFSYLTSFEDNS